MVSDIHQGSRNVSSTEKGGLLYFYQLTKIRATLAQYFSSWALESALLGGQSSFFHGCLNCMPFFTQRVLVRITRNCKLIVEYLAIGILWLLCCWRELIRIYYEVCWINEGGESTFIKCLVHARQFPKCFIFIGLEILHCIKLVHSIRIYQPGFFFSVQHGVAVVLILMFLKDDFYLKCILWEATMW